jgi:hypothetical protein
VGKVPRCYRRAKPERMTPLDRLGTVDEVNTATLVLAK